METVHPLIISTSHVALPSALDAVFIPDTMTPEQWLDVNHRPAEPDPEHRLWWAVFEDAIRCVKRPMQIKAGNHSRTARIHFEAECWFASDSTEPKSFLWLCELMGQNPQRWRERLAIMPEGRFPRRRPKVRY